MPLSSTSFNPEAITDNALALDPYPIYSELQQHAPVCWIPALRMWLVTAWTDVVEMCKKPAVFSADIPDSPLTRTIGENMLHSDGSYHAQLRAIIEPVFRSGALTGYRDGIIQEIARDLLQGFSGRGSADLVAEFAHPLSLRVLKHRLGITVCDDTLLRWSDGIALGAANFAHDPARQAYADHTSQDISDEVFPLVTARSAWCPGSVVDVLRFAISEGRLTIPDALTTVKLLIIGGLKTAGDLISVALFALLQHPEQMNEVLDNPKLIDCSVEEAIRWVSPVGTATRRAIRDCCLSDTAIPAGAMLAGVLTAANRDSRVFSNPDRFDIHRREGSHLGFAAGPHACVGALLGRYEAKIGLRVILTGLRNLQLDPTRPKPDLHGWEFRAPRALNCVFDRQWDTTPKLRN